MGFKQIIPNSLDAVSDRDFLLDLHFACSTMAMHLSRLAEEIVLWSSSEFGFITLSDSFSTGSSIMPQKKNPDFAELIRGKTGRVYGNLVQLLVTCKGLPLAYNKDLQEDKEGALDSAHTLAQCLSVMSGMISTVTVNADAMRATCKVGHLAATDVADYLTKRGMPFREAHAVVGHLVLECDKRGCQLDDLTAGSSGASHCWRGHHLCFGHRRHRRGAHHAGRHRAHGGRRADASGPCVLHRRQTGLPGRIAYIVPRGARSVCFTS